jgi:hypothetical protein
MPGCAVHFELARRVLESWNDRPETRPFADDRVCHRAFLFGSLGPDLAYFPGGDGLLADLAHCVRPADLARCLVHSAQTEPDRALGWGWVTHVLGDILIHPLINQAAAERVRGRRVPGMTYAEDPLTHIRIELGLDATLPAKRGWPDPALHAGIDPGQSAVATLAKAYRQTYGLTCSRLTMRIAQQSAAWLVPVFLFGGRVFSGRPVRTLPRWLYRQVASLARTLSPGSRIEAFTNPLPPPVWLLDESAAVVETFVERFQTHYASNLADLPDANLDTGEVEQEPPRYRLTVAARAMLDRRLR